MNSQGLEIFDQSAPLVGAQAAANDALLRAVIAELVAGITVASYGGVEFKAAGKFIDDIPHVYWIVLAIAEVKFLRPLDDRRKQRVDVRHRAVVQVGRRGPDAVQRPNFVRELAAHLARAVSVHLFAHGCGGWRFLGIVPVIDSELDELAKRGSEFIGGDSEGRRGCDATIHHVRSLGGISADVRDGYLLEVEVALSTWSCRPPLRGSPELRISDGSHVAALANLFVEDRAFRGEFGINGRQDIGRPFRRAETVETRRCVRRFSSQEL